jgi:hypothetical protein
VVLCAVRHVGDAELCDEIKKDVLRTHPDLQFFLDPQRGGARYAALLRCLFLYAKLNPGVRYVQGTRHAAKARKWRDSSFGPRAGERGVAYMKGKDVVLTSSLVCVAQA